MLTFLLQIYDFLSVLVLLMDFYAIKYDIVNISYSPYDGQRLLGGAWRMILV